MRASTSSSSSAPDLLNVRNPGVDTTSGYNVHSLALQLPDEAGIGQRQRHHRRVGHGKPPVEPGAGVGTRPASGAMVQVSRLGNPLVNGAAAAVPEGSLQRHAATQDDPNFANFIVAPAQAGDRRR
ncbi:MAG: DUF4331 family protein [Dehalococcoidia bacterium]